MDAKIEWKNRMKQNPYDVIWDTRKKEGKNRIKLPNAMYREELDAKNEGKNTHSTGREEQKTLGDMEGRTLIKQVGRNR